MEVKDHIIAESYKLFINRGIKTTMDDIAKHIGISKRTIYENFNDKNELLAECAELFYKQMDIQAYEFFSKADNVLSATLDILYHQRKGEQRKGMRLMVDLKKYYPDVHKKHLIKCQAERCNALCSLLNRGIEEGVFHPDLNIILTAFMFSEQASIILSEQFQQFYSDNLVQTDFSELDFFYDLFIIHIRGISTVRGIAIIEDYMQRLREERRLNLKNS